MGPEADGITFVGGLNPEAQLQDIATKATAADGSTRPEVGRFIQHQSSSKRVESVQINGTGLGVTNLQPSPVPDDGSIFASTHYKNYLREVGAFRVLPPSTQDVLVVNYFACIDGILEPLIDGNAVLSQYKDGSISQLLLLAISLISCKTIDAAAYLRLTEGGPVLKPLTFARTLYAGIDAGMKAGVEKDRLIRVQILALLSLHTDGPGGLEEASLHLSQAIHLAHTAGYHVDTAGRERNDDYPAKLYWCLWSLDKLSACLGGRPVMINDRDIGIPKCRLGKPNQLEGFDVWLSLADVLAETISFYRPTSDPDATGWEEGFPAWEDVVGKFFAGRLITSHQGMFLQPRGLQLLTFH